MSLVADSLAKQDSYIWGNIFSPCEIMQCFGLNTLSIECLACYLSGYHLEDFIVDSTRKVLGTTGVLLNLQAGGSERVEALSERSELLSPSLIDILKQLLVGHDGRASASKVSRIGRCRRKSQGQLDTLDLLRSSAESHSIYVLFSARKFIRLVSRSQIQNTRLRSVLVRKTIRVSLSLCRK